MFFRRKLNSPIPSMRRLPEYSWSSIVTQTSSDLSASVQWKTLDSWGKILNVPSSSHYDCTTYSVWKVRFTILNRGWKQISLEKEKGCGRKVTTETSSNMLCGCPSLRLTSLILMGSDCSFCRSKGSLLHSESQILSSKFYDSIV